MELSTVGWLKDRLKDVPDNAKIFIGISGTLWPLSPKIDLMLMAYTTKENPNKTEGEENICLYPHEGDPEKPKFDINQLPKN